MIDPSVLHLPACSDFHYDAPRENIHPTRSQSASVATYLFETQSDVDAWTNISGGTGVRELCNPGTADPAIGKAIELKTGATLGSMAGVQKFGPSIPASFGVMLLIELTAVGSNPANALHLDFQTNTGVNIRYRFYDSSVEVFLSGTWQQLIAHGGAFWTEWWLEATQGANGTYTVSLYAGTAKVTSRNGIPPAGAPGNNNLVWAQQLSGATSNRRSRVSNLQIGATQLSDPMTLVSKPQLAPQVVADGGLNILVENVCEDLSGLDAWLSADSGATWDQLTLEDRGHFDSGVIDPPKSIRILAGSTDLTNPGQALRWKIQTAAGSFLPIRRVGVWTSQ